MKNPIDYLKEITSVGYDSTLRSRRDPEEGVDFSYKVYYLVAYHDDGYVYKSRFITEDKAEIEELAIQLDAQFKNGDPLDPEKWSFARLSYGSWAYQNEGGEEELMAWEERNREW